VDDQRVVEQVAARRLLEDGALDELAVAVAVARVGVLQAGRGRGGEAGREGCAGCVCGVCGPQPGRGQPGVELGRGRRAQGGCGGGVRVCACVWGGGHVRVRACRGGCWRASPGARS
jgi:hypothetical protein